MLVPKMTDKSGTVFVVWRRRWISPRTSLVGPIFLLCRRQFGAFPGKSGAGPGAGPGLGVKDGRRGRTPTYPDDCHEV